MIRDNAERNPLGFWLSHTGSEKFDFKALDLAQEPIGQERLDNWYNVEGKLLRSDEFGNFAAGYAGYHALEWLGVMGMHAGGIYYDWKNAGKDRGNSEWDWDKDSAPTIEAGAQRAAREKGTVGRFLRIPKPICGC